MNSSMSINNKIVQYKDLQFGVLYDQVTLKKTVQSMATLINAHYKQLLKQQQNPSVIAICILKGAIIFFTDLIRHFDFRIEVDFIRLSSYHGGMSSSHEVKFLTQINLEKYRGKHLIIIQDIIDTGLSLSELLKKLVVAEPKSIQFAVLVKRPDKKQEVNCRWTGLECSDFIIGYGLDLDEQFRQLPQIYQKL